jgi:hypothetical protein
MKSSFCADKSCVEVARTDAAVLVRDGKNRDQPHLRVSREDWNVFLKGVVAGEFDA